MTGSRPRALEVEETTLPPGVAVRGEVDLEVAERFEIALDAAIENSVGAFIIDLTEVDFLDSSGLNVLVRARALLGREERALALICGAGPVRRVLEVSGMLERFVVFETRDEAEEAVVPVE